MSDSTASTANHICQLTRKIEKLQQARSSAVAQLTYRICQEYGLGWRGPADLLACYDWLKANAGPGWSKVWVDNGLPQRAKITALIAALPNGPGRSWMGTHTHASAEDPMPPLGQSVVYVLYDATNEPCYVGSSEQFRIRLRAHIRDGKPVAYWTAFPCPDRDAAYALEDRLLKQHKPYLNIKAYA